MSGVNKPKAAIVIKKEELIAFFRIEAEFCGYECEICETPPQDPSLYDLVLIDPTVGLCVSHAENCHVVALIDEKTKNPLSWATEIWEWPMSVEEIHGALARIKWSRPWQTSEHRMPVKYHARCFFASAMPTRSPLCRINRSKCSMAICNRSSSEG